MRAPLAPNAAESRRLLGLANACFAEEHISCPSALTARRAALHAADRAPPRRPGFGGDRPLQQPRARRGAAGRCGVREPEAGMVQRVGDGYEHRHGGRAAAAVGWVESNQQVVARLRERLLSEHSKVASQCVRGSKIEKRKERARARGRVVRARAQERLCFACAYAR